MNTSSELPVAVRAPRRQAFTLIELLVVVAIISLLAAILFPVFAHVREKARTASCANNMRQIATAFAQYASDNDGRLPQAWDSNLSIVGTSACNSPKNCLSPIPDGTPDNDPVVWPAKLEPYLKNRQVFSCPSARKQLRGPCDATAASSYDFGWQAGSAVVGAASGNWFAGASQSAYGYNVVYLGGGQFTSVAVVQQTKRPSAAKCYTCGIAAPESDIAKPSQTVLIIDNDFANSGGGDAPPAFALLGFTDATGELRCTADGSWDRWDTYNPRHNGGLNVAFLDGHVKWMRKENALYKPPSFAYTGNYASDDKFLWDRD
jgi:prepilin-type N-terminal cleavage/methylation domain-containing protein/prepilin-type processing-associated H-X9-DG protein